MCQFAELLSRHCSFSFSGKDMPYLRQKMTDELINRALDSNKYSETVVYPSRIIRTVKNCDSENEEVDEPILQESGMEVLTDSCKKRRVVVQEDDDEHPKNAEEIATHHPDKIDIEEDETIKMNWRKIHSMQTIPEDDEDEDEDDEDDKDWKRK